MIQNRQQKLTIITQISKLLKNIELKLEDLVFLKNFIS